MKIISWNVNGIRAAGKKGFLPFVTRENPDILCVQETKAHVDQIEGDLRTPGGLKGTWASAIKKGYSGVATFVRNDAPCELQPKIGIEVYDNEGRVVVSDHGAFLLYNIYFPNGASGKERHDFKQKFLADLNAHLAPKIAAGKQIVVVGDYNVAPNEIDVYDPVRLAKDSGFLPEERAWFQSFLGLGFVDTFRLKHPDERERFTWWSQIERARPANRGWRIDHICVTKGLIPAVRRAEILDEVEGSDHCPILIELDTALLVKA